MILNFGIGVLVVVAALVFWSLRVLPASTSARWCSSSGASST